MERPDHRSYVVWINHTHMSHACMLILLFGLVWLISFSCMFKEKETSITTQRNFLARSKVPTRIDVVEMVRSAR